MPDHRPALVEAYRRVTGDIRARTLRHASGLWVQMGSWSDDAADTLVTRLVPVVSGAEQATSASTVAFLAQYVGLPARDIPRVDVSQVTGTALRGVPPDQVYRRAVIEARATYARLREAGMDSTELIDAASQAGLRRLLGTAGTDLQLAATHTSDQFLQATGIDTYRRVTRAGACPLCVAASDRVYTVGDLLPIHTGCHCIVVPGTVLPKALQRDSNDQDPTGGRGLRIGDNAEIGPVLEWDTTVAKGGKRTRRRNAGATTDEQCLAMKRAQLDGYEKTLAEGRGTPWMEQKAAELRAEVGQGSGSAGGTPPPGGVSAGGAEGPYFGTPVDLEVDADIVRSRPDTAMSFEQALAESIPDDFVRRHELIVANWLRDQGLTVLRVRNDPDLKTPDAILPDGPWKGTVDFKEVQGLNGIRSQVQEGSLQSKRMIIDVLNGPYGEEDLATAMRLGIWEAPRPVTEIIVRDGARTLHWKLRG